MSNPLNFQVGWEGRYKSIFGKIDKIFETYFVHVISTVEVKKAMHSQGISRINSVVNGGIWECLPFDNLEDSPNFFFTNLTFTGFILLHWYQEV